MPDTYRLSNRAGLHLNMRGRNDLSARLVDVVIPSRLSVAPSATGCRPVPQHKKVRHPKTAPQPISRQLRPQQPPPHKRPHEPLPRERPQQPPPRERPQQPPPLERPHQK